MAEVTGPGHLDDSFASIVKSTKSDFVIERAASSWITQHGAAMIKADGWPGWPQGLESTEPAIETYVAGGDEVTATSDNDPFVSTWRPLVAWMNDAVRTAFGKIDVELDGDAFITASLTATDLLEGAAHMDDDTFVPSDSVGIVAICGELSGPRVATTAVEHPRLRSMSQITLETDLLDDFAAGRLDHCRCDADQLVVLPQFGQLHAGPAAHHVAELAPARQLLVMRAKVKTHHPRARLL